MDELSKAIEQAAPDLLRTVSQRLLAAHFSPVFGAAKAIEHEVAAYEALRDLGILNHQPDEYELVMRLRVTKAKARNLLYQAQLRALQDETVLENQLRELIANPLLDTGSTKGTHWVLEVPSPLLMDALRNRIRRLRFVSDGSFSPSLAVIHKKVFPALIENLIEPDKRPAVCEALRKADPNNSEGANLRDLLGGMLTELGHKAAGEAGAVFGQKSAEAICDLMKTGSIYVLDLITNKDDSEP